MSVWIMIAVVFIIFVALEELIYYSWNRHVYGKNIKLRQKWKNRLFVVLAVFKRKKTIVIETKNQEKSSNL
ncbi:hypothetical protein V7128_20900 [Neobacillus vireti]|uniref:hypothetical protein n=1 Tax=Neobacillus vireti TaxID=220686 RepID=UPI002FFD6238